MLRVQDVAKEILKKMGGRVLIENPLIRDHASNSYVHGASFETDGNSLTMCCRRVGWTTDSGESSFDVMVVRSCGLVDQPLRYTWRDDTF